MESIKPLTITEIKKLIKENFKDFDKDTKLLLKNAMILASSETLGKNEKDELCECYCKKCCCFNN